MDREPQMQDRVTTPKGEGLVVGRSEWNGSWYIGVRLDNSETLWKGFARDVELVEAAGEGEVKAELAGDIPPRLTKKKSRGGKKSERKE